MTKEAFTQALRQTVDAACRAFVDARDGSWALKGVIDIHRRIHRLSPDTKLVSKLFELALAPSLAAFAKRCGMRFLAAPEQNTYPDVTFEAADGTRFAVDIKSSYRKSPTAINGMTLGAFTGYFRNRNNTKNILYPYGSYRAHLVVGLLYTIEPTEKSAPLEPVTVDALDTLPAVLRDVQGFVQEKWRIALDRPGSGNTKNIGSVTGIEALIAGDGPFAPYGEDVFDDYWMNYLTADMARRAELPAPYYRNLREYLAFRGLQRT